jgi:hypothetical protein
MREADKLLKAIEMKQYRHDNDEIKKKIKIRNKSKEMSVTEQIVRKVITLKEDS